MTKISSEKGILPLAVLFATLLCSFLLSPVIAQETATVKVDPSFIQVGPEIPTDPFSTTLTVHDIDLLTAWQVNMTFDRTILEVVSISRPSDDVFAGQDVFENDKYITEWNVNGYVLWWVALGIAQEPVNVTDGKLCVIQFKGISEGSCNLHLVSEDETPFCVTLTWDDGQKVYTVHPILENGEVNVIPEFLAILLVPILMITSFAVFLVKKKYLARERLELE